MEDFLCSNLGYTYVEKTSYRGGGCINTGESYDTDKGRVYVKHNSSAGSETMFSGEYESLMAILKTGTIKAPAPIAWFDKTPKGCAIVMEHLEMRGLNKFEAELGTNLARMHTANRKALNDGSPDAVSQYGFHSTTCCGILPLKNEWCDDWVSFFTRNRLQVQIEMLLQKNNSNDDLNHLWSVLQRKIPALFDGIEVNPALLHGDMWSGNVGETASEPIIFDPGCFYGHSEFDFGIASMFGGFSNTFYKAYFAVNPKQPGFDKRNRLYELFHHLNHWNHFGSGYKGGTLSIMKELTK